jgi:GNAT superfamily N-acetyltransferase
MERMQEFLSSSASGDRSFHVVVAEDPAQGRVVGGSIFSYVPRSNCGFSEYLVLEPSARGRGMGRALFDHRRDILNTCATRQHRLRCNGLFIEADNPVRTPPELLDAERESSIDVHQRLRIFGHLGFQRVEIDYVQPPLGAGKESVDYLDLLFAPMTVPPPGVVPVDWILDTLEPIWAAWAGAGTADVHLAQLREAIGAARLVGLQRLPEGQ